MKNLNDSLGCKKHIDLMQTATDFRFNIFNMLSALVYSRVVQSCSYSLEYLGEEYQKIIEIYNHQVEQKYKFDTSHSYFDCTNFCFEIDKEDDFRMKGPSKENKKEPIIGLGLLLDANQIPIGMKIFLGNESERPVIRTIIDDLKQRNNISGRTIQVADKGQSAKALAGYNMIITSETHMKASKIYDAYHNLWRIEESFRIMKSQLDARPVYLQKKRNHYRTFSYLLSCSFTDQTLTDTCTE